MCDSSSLSGNFIVNLFGLFLEKRYIVSTRVVLETLAQNCAWLVAIFAAESQEACLEMLWADILLGNQLCCTSFNVNVVDERLLIKVKLAFSGRFHALPRIAGHKLEDIQRRDCIILLSALHDGLDTRHVGVNERGKIILVHVVERVLLDIASDGVGVDKPVDLRADIDSGWKDHFDVVHRCKLRNSQD